MNKNKIKKSGLKSLSCREPAVPSTACIIIPTYNEKENIEDLIHELEKCILHISDWQIKILIVDDNSPDGTAQTVEKLQKNYSNLSLMSGQKKGLGDAYRRGFHHVLKYFDSDYLFQMDADLQHHPKDIARFLNKAKEGYEFIIGSRYIASGDYSKWSLKRKIFSRNANFIARYIAGIKDINDCTSGFRCISTKFLKSFNLDILESNGYAFQMSLLHAATAKGIKILEIPIRFPDRQKGASKLGFSDMTEFLLNAIQLRFKKYEWIEEKNSTEKNPPEQLSNTKHQTLK